MRGPGFANANAFRRLFELCRWSKVAAQRGWLSNSNLASGSRTKASRPSHPRCGPQATDMVTSSRARDALRQTRYDLDRLFF
jgi:hypothetical protein